MGLFDFFKSSDKGDIEKSMAENQTILAELTTLATELNKGNPFESGDGEEEEDPTMNDAARLSRLRKEGSGR